MARRSIPEPAFLTSRQKAKVVKMADNKYGEMYTEDELVALVTLAVDEVIRLHEDEDEELEEVRSRFTDGNIREVARTEIERVFLPGEPLFILRGKDRRALGAIRWYRDHQWPSSTPQHLDSIDEAVARFEAFRKLESSHMKEPD